MPRVLLFATTTGYQTRMFADAAMRLGVELVYVTDRCDQLDDPWRDGAISVRYHDEHRSEEAVVAALEARPANGVLAVGDRPAVLAARVADRLGLPSHSPESAGVARDKRLTRQRLAAAGLPSPTFFTVPVDVDPASVVGRVPFPAVLKPTTLSASRGVMRVDDERSFVEAFSRLVRLLRSPEIRERHDEALGVIQIENYIPGREYAVEGLLDQGRLRVLALFDKPDPLDGPFFEETIYVTPSRAQPPDQQRIVDGVRRAVAVLGLRHGPIHAECRVNAAGVYVLEVAARPIGGLCAQVLRFEDGTGRRMTLEELLLRHALGEPTGAWARELQGAAVMMIPIPKAGVFRRVEGIDEACAVAGVEGVRVTAKPDQRLVPLPEGASYLGFIFARAATPREAERAVRHANACLKFTIEDPIEVVSGAPEGLKA